MRLRGIKVKNIQIDIINRSRYENRHRKNFVIEDTKGLYYFIKISQIEIMNFE